MRLMTVLLTISVASCTTPTLLFSPVAILPVKTSCSTARLPQPAAGAGPVVFPNGFTGGTLTGGSANVQADILLQEGGRDLVVVVQNDLTVSADILFPFATQNRNSTSPDILLVSLSGKVKVDPDVIVGTELGVTGPAATGTNGTRNAAASNGVNGGEIKIIGANIEIEGQVAGHDGGEGGVVDIIGGGTVFMSAGDGGRGGNVILCALDTIRIATPQAARKPAGVKSGDGGDGGVIYINVYANANGTGGSGGIAGDVQFIGTDQGGTPVQIRHRAVVFAGQGGEGAIAHVSANTGPPPPVRAGHPAEAQGGSGGNGGHVLFLQSEHVAGLGSYRSGDGGDGEQGDAHSNDGPHAAFASASGPSGTAQGMGGKGGTKGNRPIIPLPNNRTRPGIQGNSGSGGRGWATTGMGGDHLLPARFAFIPLRTASKSGVATAIGGKNGDNKGPKGPAMGGPNPVRNGGRGGRGAVAIQRGQP